MIRTTDAAYVCQCELSSPRVDKVTISHASGDLLDRQIYPGRGSSMWGLQILVCGSCLGLKVHMKYPKQRMRKFEDWHSIEH